MEHENKITVSFRISPRDREEILAIGDDSFSKGISILLEHYRENPAQQESEGSLKIKAAEKKIAEIIRDYGESNLTQKLQEKLDGLKKEYLNLQIRDTRDIFKDIEEILA